MAVEDRADPAVSAEVVREVLEQTVAFYERFLWESDTCSSVRARLARAEIEASVLHDYQVGYAPGEWAVLLDHLGQWGYSAAELTVAGIATRSDRGRLHEHFRSRLMFPIRDADGAIAGFAGQATNPGPSWPEWLTSPDSGHYRRATAIFGIDRAAPPIARAGRALVVSDCLAVLRLHQLGHREAVAVIRAPITAEHLRQLARVFGSEAAAVESDGELARELGVGSVRVVQPSSVLAGHEDAGGRRETTRFARGGARTGVVPDAEVPPSREARALQALLSAVVGIGMPIGWLTLIGADNEAIGGESAGFVVSVGAVIGTYVVLTLVASVASGRVRARSRARRMRNPWERGATEWQPMAWTYHMFEEVLIAAALTSVVTCTILFLTVGGFTA